MGLRGLQVLSPITVAFVVVTAQLIIEFHDIAWGSCHCGILLPNWLVDVSEPQLFFLHHQSDAQIETVGKFAGNDPFLGNTFLGNEVKWLTSCHWTTEHFFQRQYCPGTVLSAARSAIRSRAGFDFEDFWLQRWALWISIFSSIVFIYLILLHKGPWGHRSCQQILHACSAPYLQQEAL